MTSVLDADKLCVRMARTSSARAPRGIAGGTCRPSRHRGEAPRGKEWVRPYKQAQRALDDAVSMLVSTIHTVLRAGQCASRPVQSKRILIAALRQVAVASKQHAAAKRNLDETAEAIGRTPQELQSGDAAMLLELASKRCQAVLEYIYVATNEILLGNTALDHGVVSGELVPEDPSLQDPSGERPRRRVIVIRSRPLFVRAFLASRRSRVADRIAPVLRRRRRTPLPAEVRVPRRNLLGRAPPLSSTCLL